MLSREEYEDGVIRMYDSIRSSMHKGKEDCEGVSCVYCPLNGVCDDAANAFDMIEVVENWAKEHPIVTNADKFREVFGFDMTICWDNEFPCNECQFCDKNGTCNSKEKFWNAEYKEPAESEDKE